MKVCCSDCVGMGGWIEWVGEEGVEEEALCEICTADCSIQLLYGIGCCSTHIGYFCGVCLYENDERCLDCGSAFSTDKDGVFILGDKQFDCAECIGCFENGKDYCKGCGFDMNIWNEKDEEEEEKK